MACIPSFLLYPGKSQVCILYICQNLHMFPEDSSLRKKGKKHVTKYICKLQAHTRNDDPFAKTTTFNYRVRYLSWLIGFRNNEQVICGKQRILSKWKACNRFFFTLSIAKDNVLKMRVPWKTMSSSQLIHHLDELWLTKKNGFGKIKDSGIKNYVRIKNNT